MPSVDEHLTIAPSLVVDAVHKEASRLTCPFKVYVKKSKYALSFVPIAKSMTSFEGFHSFEFEFRYIYNKHPEHK